MADDDGQAEARRIYFCPSDAELAAMTEAEILGSADGETVEHVSTWYPILLGGVSRGVIDEWELGAEYYADPFDLAGSCCIDLQRRTVVHGSRCQCIEPGDVLTDYAFRP